MMTDSQPFVLMIQPSRFQGCLWRMALKSQNISVIWEPPEIDLIDNLIELSVAGLTLPHLLLIDIETLGEKPYAFCRWCRAHHPGVKIVLTNRFQRKISAPEREWAIHQGAADLLPGFHRDKLVTRMTASMNRILSILEGPPLNEAALIAVLLKLQRELKLRRERRQNAAEALDEIDDMDEQPDLSLTDALLRRSPPPKSAAESTATPQNGSQKGQLADSEGDRPASEPSKSRIRSLSRWFSNS
ncbi:MAG: hypothetical protein VKK04_07685 [Synechococcales bacterium]|nr:hypothetical protein [Synechococcales bacterium]